MLILTIRTDKPESEIGLYKEGRRVAYEIWPAHRQLAETLHSKIQTLLAGHNAALTDVNGIACYAGPGSFTGLRIGLSVANALSYSLNVPIVAKTGSQWAEEAVNALLSGLSEPLALPYYGAEATITTPK